MTQQAFVVCASTCSAAPRVGVVGDDAREPKGPEVQVELLVVVLSQQLGVDLGHAVYGLRSLNAQVGRWVPGGLWTEGSDGAWHEELQVVLLGQLHHVVKACK